MSKGYSDPKQVLHKSVSSRVLDIFIYQSPRMGPNGVFYAYKFKTMRNPVRNGKAVNPSGPESDNERVTRIGNILRKTGLDEIPQIINVIQGDMCLVGANRPIAVKYNKEGKPAPYSDEWDVVPGKHYDLRTKFYKGALFAPTSLRAPKNGEEKWQISADFHSKMEEMRYKYGAFGALYLKASLIGKIICQKALRAQNVSIRQESYTPPEQ